MFRHTVLENPSRDVCLSNSLIFLQFRTPLRNGAFATHLSSITSTLFAVQRRGDHLPHLVSRNAQGKSFHEKADPCQEFFALSRFLPFSPSCQAASVATLPSALFWERGSLGASWVF